MLTYYKQLSKANAKSQRDISVNLEVFSNFRQSRLLSSLSIALNFSGHIRVEYITPAILDSEQRSLGIGRIKVF